MISERAKDGIHQIFLSAAQSRLALDPDDVCDIKMLEASESIDPAGKRAVVITISSISFRLLVVFHLGDDQETQQYFAKKYGNAESCEETFSEIANLCCGAVNQEMLRYFPDLGMSTPYTLNSRCISLIHELRPGYVSHYAITINDLIRMHATVCMCERAPVDFIFDPSDIVNEAGELELF